MEVTTRIMRRTYWVYTDSNPRTLSTPLAAPRRILQSQILVSHPLRVLRRAAALLALCCSRAWHLSLKQYPRTPLATPRAEERNRAQLIIHPTTPGSEMETLQVHIPLKKFLLIVKLDTIRLSLILLLRRASQKDVGLR